MYVYHPKKWPNSYKNAFFLFLKVGFFYSLPASLCSEFLEPQVMRQIYSLGFGKPRIAKKSIKVLITVWNRRIRRPILLYVSVQICNRICSSYCSFWFFLKICKKNQYFWAIFFSKMLVWSSEESKISIKWAIKMRHFTFANPVFMQFYRH